MGRFPRLIFEPIRGDGSRVGSVSHGRRGEMTAGYPGSISPTKLRMHLEGALSDGSGSPTMARASGENERTSIVCPLRDEVTQADGRPFRARATLVCCAAFTASIGVRWRRTRQGRFPPPFQTPPLPGAPASNAVARCRLRPSPHRHDRRFVLATARAAIPASRLGSAFRTLHAALDTIYAPATGYGRTAVAVVRISGPQAGRALSTLIRSPLPPARRLSLRMLREPATGDLLDHALVAWLPGPGTATGEDMAELHLHGGPAVRAAVLRSLGDMPGLMPAEAGAFTRRAFLNGRMDLTAVEGLADLIDAETEAQRRQAVRQLDGALGRAVEGWRATLLDVLAATEAALDFSDEGDVDDEALPEAARSAASHARDAIRATLADGRRGERLRDGFTVVLAGAPNAGKSTLLNALARRDVAIVSDIPGTTRDAIEVRCDLGGLPVLLVDTAGLRDSTDAIEVEGVARSRRRIDQADLVLWLCEPGGDAPPPLSVPVLVVATKVDLSEAVPMGQSRSRPGPARPRPAPCRDRTQRRSVSRQGTPWSPRKAAARPRTLPPSPRSCRRNGRRIAGGIGGGGSSPRYPRPRRGGRARRCRGDAGSPVLELLHRQVTGGALEFSRETRADPRA